MRYEFKQLQDILQASESMMTECYEEAKSDLSFWYGTSQWGGSEGSRAAMGRTSYVFNNMPSLTHPVTNAVRQAPPAIKVIPLGPGLTTEVCARAASRIRLLEAQCCATDARMHALNRAAISGIGGWRTIPKKINGKWRPYTELIEDITTVFPDPTCKRPSFDDGKITFDRRKASRRALRAAFKDSEWAQANELEAPTFMDDQIDIVEAWYIDEDKLVRAIMDGSCLIGDEVFGDDENGYLKMNPYSFVTGEIYVDDSGARHYTSLVRFAKASQVAINYAENEWMSDIASAPKAKYLATADAVEDYEDEWETAHTVQRMVLHVKDPSKLVPIQTPDNSARYAAVASNHKAGMQQIAGVNFNSEKNLEQVSGKSAKLQIAQSSTSTFHYCDSLNRALEHDGWVYLDQMRVYENNGELRAVLLEDGSTVVDTYFGRDINGDGVIDHPSDQMRVDFSKGEFGIQISTGPSYGSQLEQVQDLLTEVMKIPAMAGSVPLLMTLFLRRLPIPESEDVIQALLMQLPPPVQQLLANKGDNRAKLAMFMQQLSQAQAQLQQLSMQNQQLTTQLQQSNMVIQSRSVQSQQDNAAKMDLERLRAENERLLERQRFEQDMIMKGHGLRGDIISTYARTQSQLDPYHFVPPQLVTPGQPATMPGF